MGCLDMYYTKIVDLRGSRAIYMYQNCVRFPFIESKCFNTILYGMGQREVRDLQWNPYFLFYMQRIP